MSMPPFAWHLSMASSYPWNYNNSRTFLKDIPPEEPKETPEQTEERKKKEEEKQKAQDQNLAAQLANIIENSVDKIKPILSPPCALIFAPLSNSNCTIFGLQLKQPGERYRNVRLSDEVMTDQVGSTYDRSLLVKNANRRQEFKRIEDQVSDLQVILPNLLDTITQVRNRITNDRSIAEGVERDTLIYEFSQYVREVGMYIERMNILKEKQVNSRTRDMGSE
ncbi:hypothetical protein F5884DRAFT_862736 [Xylogone sp. PMI_703]|nr:hypothetical protein F5884DRAFT_862736 [Xylogone sp. PMI_703]